MMGRDSVNMNFALSKTTGFTERIGMQLRLETVNTPTPAVRQSERHLLHRETNANFGFVTAPRHRPLARSARHGGPRSIQLEAES